MKNVLSYLKSLFTKIAFGTQSIKLDLSMELITTYKDSDLRCVEFYFENTFLLTGDDIAEGIYNSLFKLELFKSLGDYKMIIVTGKDDQFTFNVHPNVLVNNETTYSEYFNSVKDLIQNRYDESGYVSEVTRYFIAKVWNMDDIRNKTIKTTRIARGKTASAVKGVRGFATSACVLNEEVEKPLTDFQKYQEWMEQLEVKHPESKDFITHYKYTYADTAEDRFATLDLETVKLPLHNDSCMYYTHSF